MRHFCFAILIAIVLVGCDRGQSSGKVSESQLNSLIAKLGNEKWRIRRDAAWDLKELGPKAEPAVDPLIETLKDKKEAVRLAAVHALKAIGTKAQPAVPELLRLATEDPDNDVKNAAKESLKTIQPDWEKKQRQKAQKK